MQRHPNINTRERKGKFNDEKPEFENQVYNNVLNVVFVLQAYKNVEAYLHQTLELIESNIND